MKNIRLVVEIVAVCTLLVGCNNYEKLLNGNDYDAKFAAAMKYYNENSFSKAIQLFENLSLHYRGRENAENIGWYYAQALYKEKDYFTAAYQYKRFSKQFPYSERAEEASYMAAYCKYLESPVYSLDQQLTKSAIEDFEAFAERYPRSTYMPEVIRCLDELRGKLVKKEYEIAYGYYFTEQYHAAYESFKKFLNMYPEATQREEAMFYMLRSGYDFAANSREDKQKERFQLVVNDFDKFSSGFSDSKHLAEAQELYTKARAALAAIEMAETANR